MNQPTIALTGVSVAYRQASGDGYASQEPASKEHEIQQSIAAIHDISLTANAGSITLICGASGSGKSTLIRLINGLIPHFNEVDLTGSVKVMGKSIPDSPIEQIGEHSETVFQNPKTQFFTAEVLSELAFRGENWGQAPSDIFQAVQRAAKAVGIEDLLDQSLQHLSGGQLQKVACAQALVPNPPVIIFDEPTSNLSPQAIDQFRQLLATLKAAGHTIVVAEHRLYFLDGLADHVVVMDQGRVIHTLSGEAFFAMDEPARRTLGLRSLKDPRTPLGPKRDYQPRPDDLVLHDVGFRYRTTDVLKIADATFAAGKITAITGDNGVGKSTLARVLCGLARPRKGSRISQNGKDLRSTERLESSSMVMQDVHRQLFSESVLNEVLIGQQGEEAVANAKVILDSLGLGDTLERHPLSLSGGQKQRLVIASAVVANKRLYIFDEPTSGVDHRHLQGISAQMRALADQGAVVLVITHDPELISTCADHIAVMHQINAIPEGEDQLTFYMHNKGGRR